MFENLFNDYACIKRAARAAHPHLRGYTYAHVTFPDQTGGEARVKGRARGGATAVLLRAFSHPGGWDWSPRHIDGCEGDSDCECGVFTVAFWNAGHTSNAVESPSLALEA